MKDLTDCIAPCPWEHISVTWHVLVDDACQAICGRRGRLPRRDPEPDFGDSEVITFALITETFFHGNDELRLAFLRQ